VSECREGGPTLRLRTLIKDFSRHACNELFLMINESEFIQAIVHLFLSDIREGLMLSFKV
jgi:hypothetical protein